MDSFDPDQARAEVDRQRIRLEVLREAAASHRQYTLGRSQQPLDSDAVMRTAERYLAFVEGR